MSSLVKLAFSVCFFFVCSPSVAFAGEITAAKVLLCKEEEEHIHHDGPGLPVAEIG